MGQEAVFGSVHRCAEGSVHSPMEPNGPHAIHIHTSYLHTPMPFTSTHIIPTCTPSPYRSPCHSHPHHTYTLTIQVPMPFTSTHSMPTPSPYTGFRQHSEMRSLGSQVGSVFILDDDFSSSFFSNDITYCQSLVTITIHTHHHSHTIHTPSSPFTHTPPSSLFTHTPSPFTSCAISPPHHSSPYCHLCDHTHIPPTQDAQAAEAKEAGADIVGGEELAKKVRVSVICCPHLMV